MSFYHIIPSIKKFASSSFIRFVLICLTSLFSLKGVSQDYIHLKKWLLEQNLAIYEKAWIKAGIEYNIEYKPDSIIINGIDTGGNPQLIKLALSGQGRKQFVSYEYLDPGCSICAMLSKDRFIREYKYLRNEKGEYYAKPKRQVKMIIDSSNGESCLKFEFYSQKFMNKKEYKKLYKSLKKNRN